MDNHAYALATGLFVLLLGTAIVVVAIWLKGPSLPTHPYIVVTQGSVNGLVADTPVFFRGMAAGKVDSIEFDPANARDILVRINVNDNIPITRSTVATLKLKGITGTSQLALDDTQPGSPLLPTSAASPARIPMRASLLDTLSTTGTDVLAQLAQVTKSLNLILDSNGRTHIQKLLAQTDAASAELLTLEHNLNRTAVRLPDLTRQADNTLAHIDSLTQNLNRLTMNLNGLSHSGQSAASELTSDTLPRLNTALDQLARASANIRRLSNDLNQDPQRLLLGPQKPPPGPGEPGYKEPPR